MFLPAFGCGKVGILVQSRATRPSRLFRWRQRMCLLFHTSDPSRSVHGTISCFCREGPCYYPRHQFLRVTSHVTVVILHTHSFLAIEEAPWESFVRREADWYSLIRKSTSRARVKENYATYTLVETFWSKTLKCKINGQNVNYLLELESCCHL